MTEIQTEPTQDAATVTKKSKSNLAFAFACIPRDRRADMVTFYAYCRLSTTSPTTPGCRRERNAGA